MILRRRKWFDKSFEKVDKRIAQKTLQTLELFANNPFDPQLQNHALQGKRKGQRSLNVTGDRRIVFKELSDGKYELVELIELGTHSELYG